MLFVPYLTMAGDSKTCGKRGCPPLPLCFIHSWRKMGHNTGRYERKMAYLALIQPHMPPATTV